MEFTISSKDLGHNYHQVSNQCKTSKKPVFIINNEKEDTVLLGFDQYKQMIGELELLRTLLEAENDVQNENVKPVKDTFESLRERLN